MAFGGSSKDLPVVGLRCRYYTKSFRWHLGLINYGGQTWKPPRLIVAGRVVRPGRQLPWLIG
jgi:hypothetical protein